MGGYVIWIVLGSLIGIVAIFIVVTTILDRKKRSKLKVLEKEMKMAAENAKHEILHYVNEIIKHNDRLLSEFVPSVGKIKMSDVRDKAKKAMKRMIDSEEFKLIAEEDETKELSKVIHALKSTNSNLWIKSNELAQILKEIKDIDETKVSDEYKENIARELKEIY